MSNITLLQGDCLDVMKKIPDGSIDLIISDPPYGTIHGIKLKGWDNETTKWDKPINPYDIFINSTRILRQNGKAIIFSQEPYTSKLINSQINTLPFLYRAIWYKNISANILSSKTAMVNRYEDICIFQKKHDAECTNILRNYFYRVLNYIGVKSCKDINKKLGHRKAEHCFYVTGKNRKGSSQFSLCSEDTYNELISIFNIDKMEGFLTYSQLKNINIKYSSIFNLWEGRKTKSNVLEYARDNKRYHPTQKPILLLEDLIKTYSNENDTILDFTMGSGSTGVACINTNRNFIGIEIDEKYFNISKDRIKNIV